MDVGGGIGISSNVAVAVGGDRSVIAATSMSTLPIPSESESELSTGAFPFPVLVCVSSAGVWPAASFWKSGIVLFLSGSSCIGKKNEWKTQKMKENMSSSLPTMSSALLTANNDV
jgi:hypothetical protein